MNKEMKTFYRTLTYILLIPFLISCAPEKNQKKKYRDVSMTMDYSEGSLRSTSKINEDLLMGIGTEAVYLVANSVAFESNYRNLSSYEDRALTDTTNNKVTLTLPLDTTIKIYAYRFTESFTLNDLDSLARTTVSFGKSGSFSVSSSTTSLTINLTITPNGNPGLDVRTPSVSINNEGGSVTFTAKLLTQPKETVTVPISIDNTSIATLSSNSLSFTPLTWSTSQSVTLTGDNNTNYSDNVTLTTSLGPTTSEDISYSGLTNSFTINSTGFPQTPDNLTVTADNASVFLDWNPTASATSYNVYWDNVSGVDRNDNKTVGISTDNYTVNNLTNGITYYFKVDSLNSNGISALSNEVSAIPFDNSSSTSSDNLSLGEWAHWTLDDTSGSDNVSSRDLTVTGTPTIDNATWDLNENQWGEYVLKSGESFDNDNISISIRFKAGSNISNYDSVLSSHNDTSTSGAFQVDYLNGDIRYYYNNNGSHPSIIIKSSITKNNWYHYVITRNSSSSETKQYIDGALLNTSNISQFKLSRFRIGVNRTSGGGWIGNIDDVRIYNYVLSSDNVTSIYQLY